jgi:hypothetical protein
MSRQALETIIGRAVIDAGFRQALFADPDAALTGYDLTEEEAAALKRVDAESLDASAQQIGQRIAASLAKKLVYLDQLHPFDPSRR